MPIIEDSYCRLYPDKEFPFEASVRYTRRFKPYNANVRKKGSALEFHLSEKWRGIDSEIRIGLIQELLLKILKDRKKTSNIDIYNNFIRSLHVATAKDRIDPLLEASFHRVNEQYFSSMAEMPNLVFAGDSHRKLATYDYHTDTVSLSTRFRHAPQNIIDYLVYHELLHKKLRFKAGIQRTTHHGKAFRLLENEFQDANSIEKEIQSFLRQGRRFMFFPPI